MKTLLKVLFALGVIFIVTSVNAQIKVLNGGNVGIGIDPGTYKFQIQNGTYRVLTGSNNNGYGSGMMRIYNSVGSGFSVNSFRTYSSLLVTHLGVNYCIDGGTSLNKYVEDGNKKAPVIELNAEDGSITLYGENGTGGAYRSPTHNKGITVFSDGNVGIKRSIASYALDVYGQIAANGVVLTSDERLKSNVKNLPLVMDSLKKLRAVSYKLMTKDQTQQNIGAAKSIAKSDSSTMVSDAVTIDSALYNHSHMGFIAQELQKVYPDLVYTDKEGMLSVDYISLIPVLVEAIKELDTKATENSALKNELDKTNKKVAALESKINQCCGKTTLKSATADAIEQAGRDLESHTDLQPATLYQNTPNPFTQSTEIKYYLPLDTKQAMLYLYNMQGNQIKAIAIPLFGSGSININGNELKAGLYLYTLVADGQEVDTKKMILTE
jgi:hypothetical protein